MAQKARDRCADPGAPLGMVLAALMGAGLAVGGIALLISGAIDPCTAPPHVPLPLPLAATVKETAQ